MFEFTEDSLSLLNFNKSGNKILSSKLICNEIYHFILFVNLSVKCYVFLRMHLTFAFVCRVSLYFKDQLFSVIDSYPILLNALIRRTYRVMYISNRPRKFHNKQIV